MDLSVWKRSKVWNDDDKEYVENYEDTEYRIPAKNCIIMSRHDANRFVHQWRNPVDPRDKIIKFFKKLRIEPIWDVGVDKADKFPANACIICKMNCGSQMALKKHMAAAHPEVVIIKEEDKDDTGGTGDTSEKSV